MLLPKLYRLVKTFKILLWKNARVVFRSWGTFIYQFFIPLFLVGTALVFRFVYPLNYIPEIRFNRLPLNNMPAIAKLTAIEDKKILYSPKCPFMDELMNYTLKFLNTEEVQVLGLYNSTELESYMLVKGQKTLAFVQFDDLIVEETQKKKIIEYKIRMYHKGRLKVNRTSWDTAKMINKVDPLEINDPNLPDGSSLYYSEGFVAIQYAMYRAFLVFHNYKTPPPNVTLVRFPIPTVVNDPAREFRLLVPVVTVMLFMFCFINIINIIAKEKELNLLAFMKLFGVPNWLCWTTWFLTFFLLFLMLFVFVPWMYTTIYPMSNKLALMFVFMVYASSLIFFAILFVVLFRKPLYIQSIAFCLFISPFCLKYYFELPRMTPEKIYSVSIISPFAIYSVLVLIEYLEDAGVGLQWNNLFQTIDVTRISVGNILVTMFVCSIIYLSCIYYFERVLPNQFGTTDKWYFPCTPHFWMNRVFKRKRTFTIFDDSEINPEIPMETPPFKEVKIKIRSLKKEYKKVIALDTLNLDIYEGDITIFLGKNGAGKTSLLSILSGMSTGTSGTILINGFDIRYEMKEIQDNIGICPQQNILFDELSFEEHIFFFSTLRGLTAADAKNEVIKYSSAMDMADKINVYSMNMSSGMKRKLCASIAFCGGPRLVLFDEPTAGLDPKSRRSLWALIQSEKAARSIVLSTHFMDEADILGDRIAILDRGSLKCYGSPFYLKDKFGKGYSFIVQKGPAFNLEYMTNLLQQSIPNLMPSEEKGPEIIFTLPRSFSNKYESLLETIEDRSRIIGANGFGITNTNLEEVFMTVTNSEDQGPELEPNDFHRLARNRLSLTNPVMEERARHVFLYHNQFVAMFYKYLIYLWTHYINTILKLALPGLIMWFFLYLKDLTREPDDIIELDISLRAYKLVTSTYLHRTHDIGKLQNFMYSYMDSIPPTGAHHKIIEAPVQMERYLLNLGHNDFITYAKKALCAVSVLGNDRIMAWFNNQFYHSIPITLQLVYDALIDTSLGEGYQLQAANYPIPETTADLYDIDIIMATVLEMGVYVAFSFTFLLELYVLHYSRERDSGAKRLQFMSGVLSIFYWTPGLIIDIITYITSMLFVFIAIWHYNRELWQETQQMEMLAGLAILFFCAALPFNLLLSRLFEFINDTVVIVLLGVLFGIAMACYTVFVQLSEKTPFIKNSFFLFHPYYNFYVAYIRMTIIPIFRNICQEGCDKIPGCRDIDDMCDRYDSRCCDLELFSMHHKSTGQFFLAMAISVILYCFLLIFCEYGYFSLLIEFIINVRKPVDVPTEYAFADPDVIMERTRIHEMTKLERKEEPILANDLTKIYKKFIAVNGLCLNVKRFECFGLMGVNGAGKTTSFKMMMGIEKSSKGRSWIYGKNVAILRRRTYDDLGYCPQFDLLPHELTARQILIIFGLLRGVPLWSVWNFCLQISVDLGFYEYLDRKYENLSGGNKRKLSCAVSLLGETSILFLDEPSAGMDPLARRNFWTAISRTRQAGKSVVLTTHNMEECEALCTNSAIMVNGEFTCLGSNQYLKNRYNKGFMATMQLASNKLTNDNVEAAKAFFISKFPTAVLREQYMGRVSFQVPVLDKRWSAIFSIMESTKALKNIDSYSVTQTTLEQVFMGFAEFQMDKK